MAVLAIAASSAEASTIYATSIEWLAAVQSVYTADFEGIPAGSPPVTYHTATGYTAGPVNVVGYGAAGAWFLRQQHGTAASIFNWGTGALLESANTVSSTQLRITLSGSPTAFGLNLMTLGYGNPVGISIDGGPEVTVPTSSNKSAPTFWGITQDTPISTVELRPLTANTILLIDNVATALAMLPAGDSPGDVPEPAAMLLTASGLFAIGMAGRRRTRAGRDQFPR